MLVRLLLPLLAYASAACIYLEVPFGALYEPLSPPLENPVSLLDDRVLVNVG